MITRLREVEFSGGRFEFFSSFGAVNNIEKLEGECFIQIECTSYSFWGCS